MLALFQTTPEKVVSRNDMLSENASGCSSFWSGLRLSATRAPILPVVITYHSLTALEESSSLLSRRNVLAWAPHEAYCAFLIPGCAVGRPRTRPRLKCALDKNLTLQ